MVKNTARARDKVTDKQDRSGGASKDQAALQSDIGSTFVPVEPFEIVVFGGTGDLAPVSYTHLRAHRDGLLSRMPSSA